MVQSMEKVRRQKNLILIIIMAAVLYGFFFGNILMPDKEASDSERRYLLELPKPEIKSIKTGKFMRDFELYSMDQFVMREGFRSIKAVFAYSVLGQKDKEGIYYREGHFSELDKKLDEGSLSYAAERISNVCEKYLAGTDCKVYFSIIPDKNYFMADGYPHYDYGELISLMREKTDIRYISIAELLELSDYYRTDPHWRQERIVDVAERLCREMGTELPPEGMDEVLLEVPFYGAYRGRSALPVSGEELFYLRNKTIDSMKVTLHEKNITTGVYDMERAMGRDAYEMFLSGSQSMITIENPAANTDREIVIFRDSFGSSIAPIMAQGYRRVVLADIRYISPAVLGNLIDFKDQDVLFLYSTMLLNHSETLK